MGYLYSLSGFQPNVAVKWGAKPTKSAKLCGCLLAKIDGFYFTRDRRQSCVPNVCQVGKTRPNSSTLCKTKDRAIC
jgi:hypothetical protein